MVHGGQGRQQGAAHALGREVDGVLREKGRCLRPLLLRVLFPVHQAGQPVPQQLLHPFGVVPLDARQLRHCRGAAALRALLQQQGVFPIVIQHVRQQVPDLLVVRPLAQLQAASQQAVLMLQLAELHGKHSISQFHARTPFRSLRCLRSHAVVIPRPLRARHWQRRLSVLTKMPACQAL